MGARIRDWVPLFPATIRTWEAVCLGRRVLINTQIAAGYALTLRLRPSRSISPPIFEHDGRREGPTTINACYIAAGWRLAMSSLDKMLGWFPHNATEWIEFIIVALLLWVLMVVAISELELTSIS